MEIRKTIYINASPDDVFTALTSPDAILNYYPLKAVKSNWQAGGEILLEGEIDGVGFTDFGIITAMEPPTQFAYSYWSTNHGTENVPGNHQLIGYSLSAHDSGTTLVMTHSNISSEHMLTVMDFVWDALLQSLKRYAET